MYYGSGTSAHGKPMAPHAVGELAGSRHSLLLTDDCDEHLFHSFCNHRLCYINIICLLMVLVLRPAIVYVSLLEAEVTRCLNAANYWVTKFIYPFTTLWCRCTRDSWLHSTFKRAANVRTLLTYYFVIGLEYRLSRQVTQIQTQRRAVTMRW